MKKIVLDCLRRWAWLYVLGFIVAIGSNIGTSFFPPFGVFTPYVLAPMLGPLFVLGFDLLRGSAGVTAALPISAREVGIGYWIVGVCVPTVLLSLALIVSGVIALPMNPKVTLGLGDLALTIVVSFLISGCTFFVLTLVRMGQQEGLWNNVVAGTAGALWGVSAFSGIGFKFLLDSRKGDAVTIGAVAFAALVFTALGFVRCGEVVRLRARNRFASQGAVREPARARPVTTPTNAGVSGLPYMFVESIKSTVGIALGMVLFGMTLMHFLSGNYVFTEYMLVLCALLPSLRYLPGLRHLRTLPIGVNQLAVTLFVLPLVHFALCLGVVLLAERMMGLLQITQTPAAWTLAAGIAALCNAVAIRFGPKSLPIIYGGSMMTLWLPMAFLKDLPLAGHVGLSSALMIAAYAIVRFSLQSGRLYRLPPTAQTV